MNSTYNRSDKNEDGMTWRFDTRDTADDRGCAATIHVCLRRCFTNTSSA